MLIHHWSLKLIAGHSETAISEEARPRIMIQMIDIMISWYHEWWMTNYHIGWWWWWWWWWWSWSWSWSLLIIIIIIIIITIIIVIIIIILIILMINGGCWWNDFPSLRLLVTWKPHIHASSPLSGHRGTSGRPTSETTWWPGHKRGWFP